VGRRDGVHHQLDSLPTLGQEHRILAGLKEHFDRSAEDPLIAEYAELLLGYGLLAEGSELPDSASFNRAVAELMARGI